MMNKWNWLLVELRFESNRVRTVGEELYCLPLLSIRIVTTKSQTKQMERHSLQQFQHMRFLMKGTTSLTLVFIENYRQLGLNTSPH